MPRSASRTQRLRLAFGGVAFELLADRDGTPCVLPPETRAYCISGTDSRVVADVVCALHRDPALVAQATADAPEPSNVVSFGAGASDRTSIMVQGPSLEARLKSVGPHRYAVTARIAPGDEPMLALLRGVSAAIVHREGGLVLHAAAVEVDGRAVLFVGPSGAGKSTAVHLTKGGYCFAYDHVAVIPSAHGWLSWGLPGGTAADAEMADGVVYPLAAVLRVRRAATPQVSRLSGTEALFALRESVEWADDSLRAEDMYLRAVTELASQIHIGSIATALGRSTRPLLSEILATHDGKRRA